MEGRVEPLFGCQRAKSQTLTVRADDGREIKVLVVQPSVAARQRIFRAGKPGKDGTPTDTEALKLACVMECARNPDTGERRFTPHDLEVLREEPTTWIDQIAHVVLEMMTPPRKVARCIDPACEAELPESARFCPACGLSVKPAGVPAEDPPKPSP